MRATGLVARRDELGSGPAVLESARNGGFGGYPGMASAIRRAPGGALPRRPGRRSSHAGHGLDDTPGDAGRL